MRRSPPGCVRILVASKLSQVFTRWFRRGPGAEERRLLHRCRGDRELTERLIAHELARRPGLSRAAASGSALERWNRDR